MKDIFRNNEIIIRKAVAVLLAVLILIGLFPALPARAEDIQDAATETSALPAEKSEGILGLSTLENLGASKVGTNIDLEITDFDQDGYVYFSVDVKDSAGNPVSSGSVKLFYKGTYSTSISLTGGHGEKKLSYSTYAGNHDIYAIYTGTGNYEDSESVHIPISVVKLPNTYKKNDVTVSPSLRDKSTGSVSVNGADIEYIKYRKVGSEVWQIVPGNTAYGLSEGNYSVGLANYREGNTFYLGYSISSFPVTEGALRLTFAGENVNWNLGEDADGNIVNSNGEDEEFSVSAKAGYIIESVAVSPSGAAVAEYNSETGKVRVSSIQGSATIAVNARSLRTYLIKLDKENGVGWNGNGSLDTFNITENTGNKSVYPKAPAGYFVKDVEFIPDDTDIAGEDAADIRYDFKTGEVFIQNVKTGGTLKAVLEEDHTPVSLVLTKLEGLEETDRLGLDLSGTGRIRFTYTAYDALGNPAPNAKVYFKQSDDEVSYGHFGDTNQNGEISFIGTYTLANEEYAAVDGTTKSYKAVATIDKDDPDSEKKTVVKTVTLIYQSRPAEFDIGNIINSKANDATGEIHNFPDNWLFFNYPLSDDFFFNTDEGEWISAENGNITGLRPGVYGIKAAEYFDAETATFYLASHYTTLTIGIGRHTVSINAADSENVTFSVDQVYADHNGYAVLPLILEENYEVLPENITVDRPSDVGSLTYYEGDTRYIYLDGITNDIIVTVKVTEKEPVIYEFIEETEEWQKGSKEKAHFRVNGEFSKSKALKLDGELLEDTAYEVSEGSTIIDILPDTLEELLEGSHSLEVLFTDGYADTELDILKAASNEPEVTETAETVEKPAAEEVQSEEVQSDDEEPAVEKTQADTDEEKSGSLSDKAKAKDKKTSAVKTGDAFLPELTLILLLASLSGAIYVSVKRDEKN